MEREEAKDLEKLTGKKRKKGNSRGCPQDAKDREKRNQGRNLQKNWTSIKKYQNDTLINSFGHPCWTKVRNAI